VGRGVSVDGELQREERKRTSMGRGVQERGSGNEGWGPGVGSIGEEVSPSWVCSVHTHAIQWQHRSICRRHLTSMMVPPPICGRDVGGCG